MTGDESWVYGYDPEDKTAIVTVEGSQVSATKVGAPGAKQNEGHVTGVFLIPRVSYTTSRLPTGNNWQGILRGGLGDVCVNQFDENDRKKMAEWRLDPAPRQYARLHTLHILCNSFWANTAPLSCSGHHNHRISRTVWLFTIPKAYESSEGHRFEATEGIKRNSMKTLLDITKEEFLKCLQQWQKRWAKCVAAEGKYVEDS